MDSANSSQSLKRSLDQSIEQHNVGMTVGHDMTVHGDLKVIKNFYTSSNSSIPAPLLQSPPHKKMKNSIINFLQFSNGDSPPLLFTGREKVLTKLHANMLQLAAKPTPSAISPMVVLVGLGGIGKSTTSKRYAQLYRDHYKAILWINAETISSLLHSFLNFGRQLQILKTEPNSINLDETQVESIVQSIYLHLGSVMSSEEKGPNLSKQILFIFDNANQLKTTDEGFGILNFLPKATESPHKFIFLITSRNKRWGLPGNHISTFELNRLEKDETELLLRKGFGLPLISLNDSIEMDAVGQTLNALGDLLGGYPLALTLAIAAVAENLHLLGCTDPNENPDLIIKEIRRYMEEFEENGQEWLKFGKNLDNVFDPYDKIMATVWQGTLNRIQKQETEESKIAIYLLHLVSFLPTDHINIEICHFVRNELRIFKNDIEKFSKDEASSCIERRCFGLLERFSMLSVVMEERTSFFFQSLYTVRIHRLVQKCTREDLKNKKIYHSILVQLVNYLKSNSRCFLHTDYVELLLQESRFCEWPDQSYRQAIQLAIEAQSVTNLPVTVQNVYKHFIKNVHLQVDDVNHFDLCKLILSYVKHNFWEADGINIPAILDGSMYLDKTDQLYQIGMVEFCIWTLDLVTRCSKNLIAQTYGSLVLHSLSQYSMISKNEEIKKKLVEWLKQYFDMIGSGQVKLRDTSTIDTIRIFNISTVTFPPFADEILPHMINPICAYVDKFLPEFSCLYYFYRTVSRLGFIRSPCEEDNQWASNEDFVSLRPNFCTRFLVQGGIDVLSKLFDKISAEFKSTMCLPQNCREFIYFVQVAAYNMKNQMLFRESQSYRFIKSLNEFLTCYTDSITTKQTREQDAEDVVLILSTWFAVFTDQQVRKQLETHLEPGWMRTDKDLWGCVKLVGKCLADVEQKRISDILTDFISHNSIQVECESSKVLKFAVRMKEVWDCLPEFYMYSSEDENETDE